MTIAVPAGVADATKLQLIADIKTALGRIAEERKVGLSVRSRSVGKRKIKRPVPAAAVANPLLGEPGFA